MLNHRLLGAAFGLAVMTGATQAAPILSGAGLVASFDFGSIQHSFEPTNADGLIIPGEDGPWTQAPLTGTGTFSATATDVDSGITWTWNPGAVETVSAWPNGGTDPLRRDYYALNSPTRFSAPVPWELTGLTPNGWYDLIFFSNSFGQRGVISITGHDAGNGVGVAPTADSEGDNNFIIVIADGSGKISGFMDVRGDGLWSTLAGIQIADYPIPEPSSLALLGLGGLMVARRRR